MKTQLSILLMFFMIFSSCKKDSSCFDGERNGNETGLDCGGDCPACFTCNDGIQNGEETGVDCGGDCGACSTCSDGLQNGNETGVDCGGDCDVCYNLGDVGPGGGIVFYDKGELSDNWRYLEASRSDQSEESQWGCKGTFIGNTLSGIGFGKLNTDLVTGKCFPFPVIFSGDPNFRLAFYYCTRLSINGVNDWFLPSKEELLLMYQHKAEIGEFTNGAYWSSSEVRAEDAWLVEFSNGDTYDDFKTRKIRVRAIRRF